MTDESPIRTRRPSRDADDRARQACVLTLVQGLKPAAVAAELDRRSGDPEGTTTIRHVHYLLARARRSTRPLVRIEVHSVFPDDSDEEFEETHGFEESNEIAERFGLRHVRVVSLPSDLEPPFTPDGRLRLYERLGCAAADLLMDLTHDGLRSGDVLAVGGGRGPAMTVESLPFLQGTDVLDVQVVSLSGSLGKAPSRSIRSGLDADGIAVALAQRLNLVELDEDEESSGGATFPRIRLANAPLMSDSATTDLDRVITTLAVRDRPISYLIYGLGVLDFEYHLRPVGARMQLAANREAGRFFARLRELALSRRDQLLVVEMLNRFAVVGTPRMTPTRKMAIDLCEKINDHTVAVPASEILSNGIDRNYPQRRLLVVGDRTKAPALTALLTATSGQPEANSGGVKYPGVGTSSSSDDNGHHFTNVLIRPTHLVIDRGLADEVMRLATEASST